jgi:hypothetical protein
MKRIIVVLLAGILAFGFFSCKENSLEKQRQNELKKLSEFMRAHYAGKDPRPSGLYYFPLEEGTGDSIKIGDRVQIFYEIMTLDSIVVRATGRYEPLELIVLAPNQLGSSASSVNALRSLHEGLTYMKKGSKSLLIFDSSLGFGQFGATGIAGFTPLRMEVEVYKVYPAQPQEETIPE